MSTELSKQLKQSDLNLLITFHLLLKHNSVKRVAEELFLSQSAVSRALGRLRETFDDDLFHRTYSGLVPTPKAKSLALPLSNIVSEIDELIVGTEFDLSQCKEVFTVSLPALIGCHLIPELIVELLNSAPRASIVEVQPRANPIPLLADGTADFVVHNFPTFDKNYFCQRLGTMQPALYVKDTHPLVSQECVSLSELSDYPIIGNAVEATSETGYHSPITTLCDRIGSNTLPSLRSVQLHPLLATLERTECILLASEALEDSSIAGHSLKRLKLEDDLQLSMDVYLIAIKSKITNPAYDWFKNLLIEKYQITIVKNACH